MALWHAHRGALRRHAQRVSDDVIADDVVAETFTVVWRRLADVPTDERSRRAWLHATVTGASRMSGV